MTGRTRRYEDGIAIRRKVLGDAHVERSLKNSTAFDEPFQEMITETAWGTVWARPGLERRERSMVTIALLAGLGNYEELELHVRATANTGATAEDLREVLMHVAVYAGVPRANHAFKVVKRVLKEMEEEAGA